MTASKKNRRQQATPAECEAWVYPALAHGDRAGAIIAARGAGWRIEEIVWMASGRGSRPLADGQQEVSEALADVPTRAEARRLVRRWALAAEAAAQDVA